MSRLRVLVVDDSALARALLRRMLEADGDIDVVAESADGETALGLVASLRPDLVTMDLLLPGMSGLEVIEQIMAFHPTPILVVTGQHVGPGSEAVFHAIQRGALDVVQKPMLADAGLEVTLREHVRHLGRVPVVRHVAGARARRGLTPPLGQDVGVPRSGTLTPPALRAATPPLGTLSASLARAVTPPVGAVIPPPSGALPGRTRRRVIGMAASAGGPAAVARILGGLSPEFPGCIALVQHLPPGFVDAFAQFVRHSTRLVVRVVRDEAEPQPGTVLVAADDRHLVASPEGRFRASAEPAVGGQRPAATLLFRSLAQVFGPAAVGVVLSGIGDDGAAGLAELRQSGGLTIAQDQRTAAVYGMPRAAAEVGAAVKVLGVDEIAAELVRALATPVPTGDGERVP
ncbi:MAG: response regulator [Deltaproteobacteria bacterium]|nr:response regulator [Deltaproteobacteria bacterium]